MVSIAAGWQGGEKRAGYLRRAWRLVMVEQSTSELTRRIVDEAADAIIYADREGVIRLWNASAATLFGYAREEALGQSLDIIIPERLRQRHWDGYRTVMETGETRYGAGELLSVPGIRKDGTRLSLEFSIAMLRDEAGSLSGIAAILRDVSERFERDRTLNARLKELEGQLRPANPSAGDVP
jgi:PAS domain S-box-containing protein